MPSFPRNPDYLNVRYINPEDTKHMKSILSRSSTSLLVAIAASTSFVAMNSVRAALIVYDGFDYTASTAIAGQNGGTGFAGGWSSATAYQSFSTISSGSLSYGGTAALPTSGNSGQLSVPNALNYPDITRNFSPITTGDLWVSFLTFTSNPNAGYAGLRLQDGTLANYGSTSLIFAGDGGGVAKFELGANNFSVAAVTSNQVYLLTVRVQNIGSGSSPISLFLNDDFTTPILTTSRNIAQVGGLDFIAGPNGYNDGSGNFTAGIDEIRVGTTLADVSAIPEPTALGLLGIAGLALVSRRRRQS